MSLYGAWLFERIKKTLDRNIPGQCFRFVLFRFGNAFVQVSNECVYINAMSASTFADRFEMSGHAANAAQAISLEDFENLRIFLYCFHDFGISCNSGHVVSSLFFVSVAF